MKKKNKDYYVYLLIDPRDNQVFYVGKGKNLRTFDHEYCAQITKEDQKNDKLKLITEIKNEGYEIKREIYSNLTEDEAFNLEAVLITTYKNRNPQKFTNIQSGHHCNWLMIPEKYQDIFSESESYEKYITNQKILFLNPHKSFDYDDDYETRYNKFKGGWRLNLYRAKKADYIFIVINHKVKYVYIPKDFVLNSENTYDFIGELDENSIFKNTKCDIKFPQLGWYYNY